MAGYGSRNHPATGFLNDLFAKALVIEDGRGTRVAILTLDLVGIDRELSEEICRELESKYRLPRANVAICCSHTHSGPVVGKALRSLHYDLLDANQQRLIDDYRARLVPAIVGVVGSAIDKLTPSELSWGQGKATFAVNRRNNKEPDAPALRAAGKLQGPIDHDVPVLKVTDAAGKLTAVLFGYACHATVLDGYDWSSDYPGFAQSELEAGDTPAARHCSSPVAAAIRTRCRGGRSSWRGSMAATWRRRSTRCSRKSWSPSAASCRPRGPKCRSTWPTCRRRRRWSRTRSRKTATSPRGPAGT